MGIASLIKEMSGWSKFAIYSTHCIKKAILCSENDDVNRISEGGLAALMDKFKSS
jgi:hypothetical protein